MLFYPLGIVCGATCYLFYGHSKYAETVSPACFFGYLMSSQADTASLLLQMVSLLTRDAGSLIVCSISTFESPILPFFFTSASDTS